MNQTKYTVSGFPDRTTEGESCPPDGSGATPAGREAPLVWIKEHLTCETPLPAEYHHPVGVSGDLLKSWLFPDSGFELGGNELGGNFVKKIQAFEAGGFELTCRSLDLEKIGAAMQGRRRYGKREAPEYIDRDNIMKAAVRAKRRVRLLTKNMGASHLVTFTKQEGPNTQSWKVADWDNWRNGGREAWENDHGSFWSPEDWGKAWDRMRRMLVKVKGEFPYVAVLEHHKKGNYHLHVAWVESPGQKVNLNLVRGCWWAVLGGRGLGNVDAKYIKVRAGLDRADRVAKYISKYTTKHYEQDGRFNKKRYWASRQAVQPARRVVMNARTVDEALNQVLADHGLRVADYMKMGKRGLELDGLFLFPDSSGFWLTYIPDKHGGEPPPF